MGVLLINQGTNSAVPVDLIGTVNYPIVKIDQGAAGASSPFSGTLLSVNAGTLDSISQLPPNYFGTTITSGTSTLGTIKPAVSGSAIFVTDIIISVGTTTSLVLGMGGTSTPFIGTLSFATQGGLVSNFRVPGSITLGSALVYQQSANNTLSITVNGFVR